MTRSTPTRLATTVAVAVAALVLAACGGDANSSSGGGPVACTANAEDYIPAQVAGQDVERKNDVTEQLESSLQQEGVDSIASGVVSHVVDPSRTAPPASDTEPAPTRPDGTPIPADDPTQRLPDIIMVAGVGQGVASTPDQLEQMKDQPDTQVDQTTIDGVDVTTLTFPKTQLQSAISFGAPCDTVFAISFAFKGGREAAELGMKTMFESAG
ncbi:MAG: hypothetical protein U0U69_08730 [Acidimicrobiia bacterium]